MSPEDSVLSWLTALVLATVPQGSCSLSLHLSEHFLLYQIYSGKDFQKTDKLSKVEGDQGTRTMICFVGAWTGFWTRKGRVLGQLTYFE